MIWWACYLGVISSVLGLFRYFDYPELDFLDWKSKVPLSISFIRDFSTGNFSTGCRVKESHGYQRFDYVWFRRSSYRRSTRWHTEQTRIFFSGSKSWSAQTNLFPLCGSSLKPEIFRGMNQLIIKEEWDSSRIGLSHFAVILENKLGMESPTPDDEGWISYWGIVSIADPTGDLSKNRKILKKFCWKQIDNLRYYDECPLGTSLPYFDLP